MSGESHRIQKVEKQLHEIIAGYVLKNFTGAMLEVTQVRVNKDLRAAKVYLRAFGAELISDGELDDVQSRAVDIQKLISEKLRMRYCPKIKFVKDEGAAAASRVDAILAKIKS